jgi:DNA-binding NarL/FixJ family response regulator
LRIVHLDDHPAVRAGVRALLESEPDLVLVGAAANEDELWPVLARTRPALVMLDVHHPGRDGFGICLAIKAIVPTPAVLLYTGADNEHLRVAARLVGADGLVAKTEDHRALLHAVRRAGARDPDLEPPQLPPRLRALAAEGLDPTERAIVAMRLAGTATADIAMMTDQSAMGVRRCIASIAGRLSESRRGVPLAAATTGAAGAMMHMGVPRLRAGAGRGRVPSVVPRYAS